MVEWKKLGEVANRNKGIPITAGQMSELATPYGNVRVFAAGQTIADIDEKDLPSNCAHREPSVIVKSRGYVDFEFYENPFTHKNEMWSYSFKDKQTGKYVYYYLTTKTEFFRKKAKANSVKLPQLCVADTDNYLIPIPLLSEQQRIVSILDTFTSSIANLKQQIEERRKQYEYERDRLLDLEGKEGVEMKKLGDTIVSLKTGLNPRKNFVLNASGANNYYITVRELGLFDIIPTEKTDRVTDEALKLINNRSNLEVGDVLFSGTGTIGRTALIQEKPTNWNIKEGVYTLKPSKGIINSRYLTQLLHVNSTMDKITALIVGDPIRSIPMKSLVTIPIPVPSLSTQSRIVSILDTFEASIKNLEEQLALREKQYEYYRNKLLTFE